VQGKVSSLPEVRRGAAPVDQGAAQGKARSRWPPDGGGRKRKEEENFASTERGNAVLRCGGMRMQNASVVCMSCWRVFFNAKALCVLHFYICMLLLESVSLKPPLSYPLTTRCIGVA
jgi:hypothetical protein